MVEILALNDGQRFDFRQEIVIRLRGIADKLQSVTHRMFKTLCAT